MHPKNMCFKSFCKERWEWLVPLFKRAMGANVVFKKEREERLRAIRSFVLGIQRWKEQIWRKSLLKRVNHSFIKSESLPSLFTKRQHSLPLLFTKRVKKSLFVKSDRSESLMSLLLKERKERKSKSLMSLFSKERKERKAKEQRSKFPTLAKTREINLIKMCLKRFSIMFSLLGTFTIHIIF